MTESSNSKRTFIWSLFGAVVTFAMLAWLINIYSDYPLSGLPFVGFVIGLLMQVRGLARAWLIPKSSRDIFDWFALIISTLGLLVVLILILHGIEELGRCGAFGCNPKFTF